MRMKKVDDVNSLYKLANERAVVELRHHSAISWATH